MPLPNSFYGLTISDNTINPSSGKPETTTSQIPVVTLSAANVVAQLAAQEAFRVALDDIVIGVMRQTETVFTRNLLSAGAAASPLAQRENKWLFRYHGNSTFKNYTISFGTADLTLLEDNSEYLSLLADEGLAVKTAFEAIARSPNDSGETVTLDSVQFVGRNT